MLWPGALYGNHIELHKLVIPGIQTGMLNMHVLWSPSQAWTAMCHGVLFHAWLVLCRLVYHPVAGSYFHPLGIPAATSKTIFALAVPEAAQVSTSIDQVFPVLIPEDSLQWNDWCGQEQLLSYLTPPERFFQTALINVARSTEVHSKVADVWEQACLIVSKCMDTWVTDRISNQMSTCNVPVPTDLEMGHMSQKQQTALLSRFEDSVKVLTGDSLCNTKHNMSTMAICLAHIVSCPSWHELLHQSMVA